MTLKQGECNLCVQDHLTSLCIVSNARLGDKCPCKSCLVRITCTSPSQSCYTFQLLYDESKRIVEKLEIDNFWFKQAGVAERPKAADL